MRLQTFYAYVIQSEKGECYYKGHCENLSERIKEHNAGYTRSIKKKTPYKLVYF
ncbi:MAG: GIY-YIG nuclease family protein [Bacteroidota bacterium]|nr:GIY-YIG nuclease family protein [Bacteroidota bacterium]